MNDMSEEEIRDAKALREENRAELLEDQRERDERIYKKVRNERAREYYEANKERAREANRRYRERHREKLREYSHKYYETHTKLKRQKEKEEKSLHTYKDIDGIRLVREGHKIVGWYRPDGWEQNDEHRTC